MRTAVAAIFAIALVLSAQAKFESCGKGEVCPEGECCMITGNRYGKPACLPLLARGDTCRPNNQPQNMTLTSGPMSEAAHYTGVYYAVCPCQSGLNCPQGTCV